MSDVFACLVERYAQGESPNNLLIGEQAITPGVPNDAFRSMADPLRFGHPDHWSERLPPSEKHSNADIANKAFALVAVGGNHSNSPLLFTNGIGFDRAGAIWWRALRYGLGRFSKFDDMKRENRQAAKHLYGDDSYERGIVDQAWERCGV